MSSGDANRDPAGIVGGRLLSSRLNPSQGTAAVHSIHETHAGVARLTPHGQLQPLHPKTDDRAGTLSRQTTVCGPGSDPAQSITRGEAEGSKSPGSKRPQARKRQTPPAPAQRTRRANRVFVMGADGIPLMPCTIQRARMLIDAGRVKKRDYLPSTSVQNLQHPDNKVTRRTSTAPSTPWHSTPRAEETRQVLQTPRPRCVPPHHPTRVGRTYRAHLWGEPWDVRGNEVKVCVRCGMERRQQFRTRTIKYTSASEREARS